MQYDCALARTLGEGINGSLQGKQTQQRPEMLRIHLLCDFPCTWPGTAAYLSSMQPQTFHQCNLSRCIYACVVKLLQDNQTLPAHKDCACVGSYSTAGEGSIKEYKCPGLSGFSRARMNFNYSLEASFVSARRSSLIASTCSKDSGSPSTDSRCSSFASSEKATYRLMDLNDVTREYEKYKRQLSLGKDEVGLREILESSPAPETGDTPRYIRLPNSSENTLRKYEKNKANGSF